MNGVLANSIHDTSVGPLYIPFGPDTKRKGGVMYVSGPMQKAGGTVSL